MKTLAQKLYIFVCISILLAMTACSNQSQPTVNSNSSQPPLSAGKKIIYVGITNPPATLNPIIAMDDTSQQLASILFESLYVLDESIRFQPKLAESFETTDNQNFVIKLNQKAKWTDGQPVTAEDILFTLQLMANPKVTSRGIQPLSVITGLDEQGRLPEGQTDIQGIKIVDPHTLTVHTKFPVDPTFLKEKLGVEIWFLPKHVLKDVEPEKLHQHPFMQKPNVTDGPFRVTELLKDQYVAFSPNKDYYRGKPKLDKLFFKVMPASNLVAQLQTGEIQMNFPAIGKIAVEDFEKVKNMSNVRTIQGMPFEYQMMFFNVKTIPDAKVRQAIAYAINRQFLVDNLLLGEGQVFEGPYTPIHPYYDKNITKYDYDPAKAKQLLQEAGWDFNKTIDLAVSIGNKTREQEAVIIAENLRAVGLNVQINKYDLPTIVQKGAKHQFDLLLLGLPFQLDPDRSYFYQTGGAYNFAGYSNPQVDELIEKGKNEADPQKRHVIYGQILEILQHDLPTLSLFSEYNLKVVSKKVTVGEPKDQGMLYNVHEWDIEN